MIFATALLALLALPAAIAQNPVHQLNPDLPVGTLVFPPNRGSSSLVARTPPCQGWERGLRTDYPLNGGAISWATSKDISEIKFRYTTEENPTSQDQFREALTNATGGWVGLQCIDGPDFSALGLNAGDAITIQFNYKTGPSKVDMYECADVTLVSTAAFEAGNWDTQCSNRITRTQSKRVSASNPELFRLQEAAAVEEAAAVAANSTTSDSGLTNVESGVVGAMVTLGVTAICLCLLAFAGFVGFGKGSKAEKKVSYHDSMDAKTVSSV